MTGNKQSRTGRRCKT